MSDVHNPNDTAATDAVTERKVRLRRAPKYPAFLIVGGGIGAIVTFVLTALFPVDPMVGFAALFGYFALYGVTAGVLLGAVLAIVLDRVSTRRAKPATAMVTTVDRVPDAAAEPEQSAE